MIDQKLIDRVSSRLRAIPFRRNVSTRSFRNEISNSLVDLGMTKEVKIDTISRITITGVIGKVGICVQTGNMSRFYADLIKLQTLFARERINAGLYILPTRRAAKEIGSNICCMERFVDELSIFSKTISMPILVLAFER